MCFKVQPHTSPYKMSVIGRGADESHLVAHTLNWLICSKTEAHVFVVGWSWEGGCPDTHLASGHHNGRSVLPTSWGGRGRAVFLEMSCLPTAG